MRTGRSCSGRLCTPATIWRTGPSTPRSLCTGRFTWSLTGCTSAVTTRSRKEPYAVRTRCASPRPSPGEPLRHPVARLYGRILLGVSPQPSGARRCRSADRRECYRLLPLGGSQAGPSRLPGGPFRGGALAGLGTGTAETLPVISVETIVAGQRAEDLLDCTETRWQAGASAPPRGSARSAISARAISATTPPWRLFSITSELTILTRSWTRCAAGRRASRPVRHTGHSAVLASQFKQRVSGIPATALKLLGKGIDAFRTVAWARRHDVVIVPEWAFLKPAFRCAARIPVRDVPAFRFGQTVFRTKVAHGQRGGGRG